MKPSSTWERPLPRILSITGLLLFLTFVFSSQLYFAGYVTPWSRAFAQEAVYWLSCGILALPSLTRIDRRHLDQPHPRSRGCFLLPCQRSHPRRGVAGVLAPRPSRTCRAAVR